MTDKSIYRKIQENEYQDDDRFHTAAEADYREWKNYRAMPVEEADRKLISDSYLHIPQDNQAFLPDLLKKYGVMKLADAIQQEWKAVRCECDESVLRQYVTWRIKESESADEIKALIVLGKVLFEEQDEVCRIIGTVFSEAEEFALYTAVYLKKDRKKLLELFRQYRGYGKLLLLNYIQKDYEVRKACLNVREWGNHIPLTVKLQALEMAEVKEHLGQEDLHPEELLTGMMLDMRAAPAEQKELAGYLRFYPSKSNQMARRIQSWLARSHQMKGISE